MGFLENIYEAGIFVQEDFGSNKNADSIEQTALCLDLETEFLQSLNLEQKKFYQKELRVSQLNLQLIEQKRMYYYAFRLARLIFKDVLIGNNNLDLMGIFND